MFPLSHFPSVNPSLLRGCKFLLFLVVFRVESISHPYSRAPRQQPPSVPVAMASGIKPSLLLGLRAGCPKMCHDSTFDYFKLQLLESSQCKKCMQLLLCPLKAGHECPGERCWACSRKREASLPAEPGTQGWEACINRPYTPSLIYHPKLNSACLS